ncbi:MULTISPECIES: hypothetical protein [Aeromonas]|uniref:hypothetical protein n=1 Tax=Aeromonas TaxID=642 RepID=UPI00214E251D|nr:hypothetical protein [Aeromonas caviae]MCR3895217.1 hypothetical protein [Aeromonas caviae]MDX7598858.1 hypothetical protein [Aeromonas caviae]MDX7804934.1 hypothetical protein [Aeromonas caviae]MDY7800760.1 hypothetical protein [Aeromonas caviae]MDY7892454.1 hypothetical protein [Aeromonas caviae]
MEHHIHLSKPVVAQLLLNGFEAFVVQHQGQLRSGIELHASVYGKVKRGKEKTKYKVEFISVDTTADMNGGFVESNDETQYLKEHLAEQMGFERIGRLHTHPYLAHEGNMVFMRTEGCDFSHGDIKLFTSELNTNNKPYLVEFLLAIKQNQRQNIRRDGFLGDARNVFEFSVGNCKCFLRAQAFSLDENGELVPEETFLQDEYLQEFEHWFAEFGRVRAIEGYKRILEYIV